MLSGFLDWFEEHKTGVIGTLTVHTLILFVCTWITLEPPPEEAPSEMRVEVIPEPEAEELVQRIIDPEHAVMEKVTNLTSNITAETRPRINQQRLSEQVEEELRALEQSERERLEQEREERGETAPEMPQLDPSKWDKERYMNKAAKPVRIEGATTVWHDLKDRDRREGAPAYLCKDQGRVAIRVTVERSGRVRKAEYDASQSYHVDECMLEQALSSARTTPFTPNASAPDPQIGTLYFLFVPQ